MLWSPFTILVLSVIDIHRYHNWSKTHFANPCSSEMLLIAAGLMEVVCQGRYQISLGIGPNFQDCEYQIQMFSILIWDSDLKSNPIFFAFLSFSLLFKKLQLSCRDMQGTSMEGPIPSTISDLKNLTELWVFSYRLILPELRVYSIWAYARHENTSFLEVTPHTLVWIYVRHKYRHLYFTENEKFG